LFGKKKNKNHFDWRKTLTKFVLIPLLSAIIGGLVSYGFFLIKLKRERAEVQDVSIYVSHNNVSGCFEGSRVVKYNRKQWWLYHGNVIIKNTGYADLSDIPVECLINGFITGKPVIVKEPVKTTIEKIEIIKTEKGQKLKFFIPALRRNQSVSVEFFYFADRPGIPAQPVCELEKPGIRIRTLHLIYR